MAKKATGKAMTVAESKELTRLERVVADGLKTFVEVGQALLEIRDKRLYRAAAKTFDVYCREKWGFSKTQGNRLIEAAKYADILTPAGVTTEREAREVIAEAKTAATPEDPVATQLEDILERRRKEVEDAEAEAKRDRASIAPDDNDKDAKRVATLRRQLEIGRQAYIKAKRIAGGCRGLVDTDRLEPVLTGIIEGGDLAVTIVEESAVYGKMARAA